MSNAGSKIINTLTLVVAIATANVFTSTSWSDAPTFADDVAPILQKHCQRCHNPGMRYRGDPTGLMPLTTYTEAKAYAKAIAESTKQRRMPPWFASQKFDGVFENQPTVTHDEITTLQAWADTGARPGPPLDIPKIPRGRRNGWPLGMPDLIVTAPEPVWVGDEVEDWRPTYRVALDERFLEEDRIVRAVDIRAGSPAVGNIVAQQRTRLKIGPLVVWTSSLIAGMVAGSEQHVFPSGYGYILLKDAVLEVSTYYHKEPGPGTGFWDFSALGFYFYPRKVTTVARVRLEAITNTDFMIPPFAPDYVVNASRRFDYPFRVLYFLPNMGARGTAAKFSAHYADGTEELLLDVPRFETSWQSSYTYAEPRRFPRDTEIAISFEYDNSTANPNNPDPHASVRPGLFTSDEMCNGWIAFFRKGDFTHLRGTQIKKTEE